MRVPSKILDGNGRPIMKDVPVLRGMQSRYDAAQTTPENKRHWAAADGLSANAANSLDVRKRLRDRARYEYANNGYCAGLVLTHANDLVGVGPTLQILTDDDALNTQIEDAFGDWSEAIGLAQKLHTMKQAKMRDGETFAMFIDNPLVDNPVQLDILDFECDHVTGYWSQVQTPDYIDGIQLDRARNPITYDVLDYHPGDLGLFGLGSFNPDYKTQQRKNILHWFRCDRPGQVRGVPEITAALPLFAQMRRWILATLSSAEVAASFSAVLENTSVDADPDAAVEGTPFETMEIVRNMMTLLPANHTMKQLTSENPNAVFEMFKREMLKEVGRCVNAPYNVVAGDSSPYNYSSAKLDRGLYQVSLRVERDSCRRNVLERVLGTWFVEAQLAGVLPESLSLKTIRWAWYWPGTTTIEPLKEASANSENLANGTTTFAELAAEEGVDWKDRMKQRAKEEAYAKELGLVSATILPRGETPDIEPAAPPTPGNMAAIVASALEDAGVSEAVAEHVLGHVDDALRKKKPRTLPMKAQPSTNGHAKPGTNGLALRVSALEELVKKPVQSFEFHMPEQVAPVHNHHTTIEAPAPAVINNNTTIEAPAPPVVNNNTTIEAQPGPIVNNLIENNLPAPVNEVTVEAAEVTVENTVNVPEAPPAVIQVGFQKKKGEDVPPVQ